MFKHLDIFLPKILLIARYDICFTPSLEEEKDKGIITACHEKGKNTGNGIYQIGLLIVMLLSQ